MYLQRHKTSGFCPSGFLEIQSVNILAVLIPKFDHRATILQTCTPQVDRGVQ